VHTVAVDGDGRGQLRDVRRLERLDVEHEGQWTPDAGEGHNDDVVGGAKCCSQHHRDETHITAGSDERGHTS
jgi:hypothetical protein